VTGKEPFKDIKAYGIPVDYYNQKKHGWIRRSLKIGSTCICTRSLGLPERWKITTESRVGASYSGCKTTESLGNITVREEKR
jgi:hypothetical protein